MADKKKRLEKITVELKVSMHCNACERSAVKALSKFKGVETILTDMNCHKVVVTGRVDPAKLLKKVKKQTGKRIEMVVNKEASKETSDGGDPISSDCLDQGEDLQPVVFDELVDDAMLTMFNDENVNACRIM